jgi:preprotein translocase subunit YajC
MDILISTAKAQEATSQGDSIFGFLLPMALIFIVFYFLLIRPQQKRQKEHAAMLKTLTSGNEVLTTGGLMGTVNSVTEHYVAIEISEGVEIKIQKSSVSAIVPKGTIDAA